MLKKIFANCIIVASIVAFYTSCQSNEKTKSENNKYQRVNDNQFPETIVSHTEQI